MIKQDDKVSLSKSRRSEFWMSHTKKIQVFLRGPLRVQSDGIVLAIKQKKSQALLALLVVAPGFTRSRAWLSARLWSNSDAKHGASSLRQSLVSLKRDLGSFAHVLRTDRINIGLREELIELDIVAEFPNAAEEGFGDAFLEGMDIGDESFEEWLREFRSSRMPLSKRPSDSWPTAARIQNVVHMPGHSHDPDLLVREFAVQVAERLHNLGLAASSFSLPPSPPPPGSLILTAWRAQGVRSVERLHALAIWGSSDTVFAQGSHPADANAPSALAQRFCERFAKHLASSMADDDLSFSVLVRGFMAPKSVGLDAMEEAASRIESHERRGLALAFAGGVRLLRYGEDTFARSPEQKDALLEEMRGALESEPDNPIVLALASQAHGFFLRNWELADELSKSAVRIAPNNPLALDLRAATCAYTGRAIEAMQLSASARSIVKESLMRPSVEATCALAATVAGDWQRAYRHAAYAFQLEPSFRTAQNYYLAASAAIGRLEEAHGVLALMRGQDKDLSLDRLRSPEYPVPNEIAREALIEGARTVGLK